MATSRSLAGSVRTVALVLAVAANYPESCTGSA